MLVEYAKLISDGIPETEWSGDTELSKIYNEAEMLNWYIQSILDERNMPVFPANDSQGNPQYINKKYIVGKPVFRFWPLGRLGKV